MCLHIYRLNPFNGSHPLRIGGSAEDKHRVKTAGNLAGATRPMLPLGTVNFRL